MHNTAPLDKNFSSTFSADLFGELTDHQFNAKSMDLFWYQYKNNTNYRKFIDYLGKDPKKITHYEEIPFMPIRFFRDHIITSGSFQPEITFSSSGTTGMITSRHHVRDLQLYKDSFTAGFTRFFGDPAHYVFLALLPAYLEREGSSLVLMADELIRLSQQPESGFFLHDLDRLSLLLHQLKSQNRKVILLGVTFALLDLAERFPLSFPELIIMETGGMKGRRKEIIREELHEQLTTAFGVEQIYSEYGMTELLSQAWSMGNGIFSTPPWMKILIRDTNDPLHILQDQRTGGINVIDLANIHSCAFLETQDLGRKHSDGSFEILGRFDHSDVRGCNLLVVE